MVQWVILIFSLFLCWSASCRQDTDYKHIIWKCMFILSTQGYLKRKKVSNIFSYTYMFCIEITMSLVWGSKFNVVFCRYCSSGRSRNSGQSEDHQETTERQCIRVPGGRGGNVRRERVKSCRFCGNTPWPLIFSYTNTKYHLCIYYKYAKYNKTVIHVTIQNYRVWFY